MLGAMVLVWCFFLSKMEILCRLIHSVENVPTIFPDVDLDLVLIS